MKKQDMNRDWIATARTLSEALPYLQRYTEAIVVIKLGGHAMTSDQGMETFARDVALMRQVGINPIIVHGGGPMINAMLKKLNIESKFVMVKGSQTMPPWKLSKWYLAVALIKKLFNPLTIKVGALLAYQEKTTN